MTDWSTTYPRFRVDHRRGVDFYKPDVGMSFDGGSLIMFHDKSQERFLHAYGPDMQWDCGVEVADAED